LILFIAVIKEKRYGILPAIKLTRNDTKTKKVVIMLRKHEKR